VNVRPLLLGLLFLTTALAGCASDTTQTDTTTDTPAGLVPVEERHKQPYVVDTYYSHPLQAGPYKELPVQSFFVDVQLPATSGGAAVIGGAGPLNKPRVHLGLFLPDVPEGTQVPVIADVGPYYNDFDLPATSNETRRLGGFLIKNFVPHGYAVAQVSVFGSGESNHCMDLMGPDEQAGIDAAVTWLGTQSWSNGKVGLIGRSYDGSTPWEAAAMGNPHLATVVPISGLMGMHELMWRNGSAETRAPIMHNVVYGAFGIDSDPERGHADPEDVQTLCQSYLSGPAVGAAAVVTGSNLEQHPYWKERYFFDRVVQNYNGSIYYIHGLQDWNVDPHMAFPYYNLLRDAGFEMKGLFGQWGHMYPDRPSEHTNLPVGHGKEAYPNSVRYDWAQDLLEWFDHYLKGTGPKPALHVEVQDNQGQWRIESGDYPVRGLARKSIPHTELTTAGNGVIVPRGPALTYEGKLENRTHISGNVYLVMQVRPLASGGQIYAELSADGLRLGHGIMDLRYTTGRMQPVAPGVTMPLAIEFEVMDAVVPAGASITLKLADTGRDYLPAASPSPVLVESFKLELPLLPEGHGLAFSPPKWSGKASGSAAQP
jgi:hypothetical protein